MGKRQRFAALFALCLGLAASLPARAEEAVLDLYLARHGQTAWNLEKRLQGSTDNPLNDTGRSQARQLGEKLAGENFAAVYSSSLARARESAALARPGMTVQALPELAERSFGKFEGMAEDGREGQEAALLAEFKARSGKLEDSLDGGESLASQARRVAQAVERIRREQPRGQVLVVSHGGVTPLILAHLLQLPVAEAVARIRQGNDEVYLVRLRPGQAPSLWKLLGRDSLEQL
ncbi:histidine phosphatase family protein [Azospira sp. I09]|uniref:histidine phosphatase family protein n=1 Tax=Azospira sp. I09 TaxID=1765049 RepID=UPI001260669C|nr:histidine phosphatase family protein [Azospira sp. I09]BBN87333.1 phosphoglycerate mutase [Azospira sp. I09]